MVRMNAEAGRGVEEGEERERGREGRRVWSGMCVCDDAESMFGMASVECWRCGCNGWWFGGGLPGVRWVRDRNNIVGYEGMTSWIWRGDDTTQDRLHRKVRASAVLTSITFLVRRRRSLRIFIFLLNLGRRPSRCIVGTCLLVLVRSGRFLFGRHRVH